MTSIPVTVKGFSAPLTVTDISADTRRRVDVVTVRDPNADVETLGGSHAHSVRECTFTTPIGRLKSGQVLEVIVNLPDD